MKKKLIVLSVFSMALFACRKEVFAPNSERTTQDRTHEMGTCPMKDHSSNLDGHCGFYGRSDGDNSTNGNTTVGDTTAQGTAITDPNNDDDENGPVSGVIGGPVVNSGGNAKVIHTKGGK